MADRYLDVWPDVPRTVFSVGAALEWAEAGDADAAARVAAADPDLVRRARETRAGWSPSAEDWAAFLASFDSWTDGS